MRIAWSASCDLFTGKVQLRCRVAPDCADVADVAHSGGICSMIERATVTAAFLAFLPLWTAASRKSFPERLEVALSTQLPTRPVCSSCGSTKVGTLAKAITKDTLWR